MPYLVILLPPHKFIFLAALTFGSLTYGLDKFRQYVYECKIFFYAFAALANSAAPAAARSAALRVPERGAGPANLKC